MYYRPYIISIRTVMKPSYSKNLRQYRKFGYYLYILVIKIKKKGGGEGVKKQIMCNLGIQTVICTMHFYMMSPVL